MTIFVKDKFIWVRGRDGQVIKIIPSIDLNDNLATQVCVFLGNIHPIFGNENFELNDVYRPFQPSKESFSNGIVLFPGSFSPWHEGHQACVFGQSKAPVVIIPDYNPWKEIRQNSIWPELKTLWKFALEKKEVSLFPGFLAKKERNPTVSWLPSLNIKEKWLLMGDDSFLSLEQWKDSDLLLNCLKGILICPRLGDETQLKAQAVKLKDKYTIEINFLPSHAFQSISSTQIRKQK